MNKLASLRFGIVVSFVFVCFLQFSHGQPNLPGGGGGGSTNSPVIIMPPDYSAPGTKLTASVSGTNLLLNLLEADVLGQYDIDFSTNLSAGSWSNVWQGAIGQTNFVYPLPASETGFFKVRRSDPAVESAGNISVEFANLHVRSNTANRMAAHCAERLP